MPSTTTIKTNSAAPDGLLTMNTSPARAKSMAQEMTTRPAAPASSLAFIGAGPYHTRPALSMMEP